MNPKGLTGISFIFLVVLVILVGCGEESSKDDGDSKNLKEKDKPSVEIEASSKSKANSTDTKEKDKPYMKLVSVTRNHAESCFDYEYSKEKRDYLTLNFSKNNDVNGYGWNGDNVEVTTKEGEKLEWILTGKDDISFKYIDSEEYKIKVRYDSIEGQEKYQTFTVKKQDIIKTKQFDPKKCKDEKSNNNEFNPPDVDKPEGNSDSPVQCGVGEHWVNGYYRDGTWVDGYCRSD